MTTQSTTRPSTVGPRDVWPLLAPIADAASQAGQPHATLAALDKALAQAIGHKLFTVLVLNFGRGENQRYYSNQPQAYATGDSKPIEPNSAFYKRLIGEGRPAISRNYDDIKAMFFDHELIRSLGCESCVNMPIRWDGKTIGTLNLLHQADWYRDDDLPILSAFTALAAAPALEIIRRW